MEVTVEIAGAEEKPVLHRLLQLYLYDFTEFIGGELSAHGEYEDPYLDHYWQPAAGETRVPYLVRVGGRLAGFALVRREGEGPWTMAEFFVLRPYRRGGVGARVAKAVFERHPGAWSVHEVPANVPAQAFWRRVIGEVTGGVFAEESDENGVTQRFAQP